MIDFRQRKVPLLVSVNQITFFKFPGISVSNDLSWNVTTSFHREVTAVTALDKNSVKL